MDAQTVTFKYKKQTSDKFINMTVSVEEFIRRFLQHVLPKNFVKVRHFGFLAANGRYDITKISVMIFDGFTPPKIELAHRSNSPRGVICSCGCIMKFFTFEAPHDRSSGVMAT